MREPNKVKCKLKFRYFCWPGFKKMILNSDGIKYIKHLK